MAREVEVWHDALGDPREDRIAEQIDWWESVGWELVERREAGRRWWWFDRRGRTILTFERREG